jgi:hypothetical protein
LWGIRPDVKVVPVPPPVRKINSKGTAVLNARRAGNRGKFQETPQDYSGFWLTPQTPTPKSAKTRLVRARARGRVRRDVTAEFLLLNHLYLLEREATKVEPDASISESTDPPPNPSQSTE